MNTEDYEKALAECWEAVFDEMIKDTDIPSCTAYDVCCCTFKHAYLLGMEAAKKEQQEEIQKESKEKENTFASDNKDFDNIIKDGFRNHNRLQIASMAMQGILSNESEVNRACQSVVDGVKVHSTPESIALYALACADALIEESKKGGTK